MVSAAGVAAVVALNTVRGQPVAAMPFGVGALLDATVFAIIAVGLSRQSRFAALSGLFLYIVEQLAAWIQSQPLNPVGAAVFILAFTNGVRGAYALRWLDRSDEGVRAHSD